MSLFICMSCGCVENTNLVTHGIFNNKYPNLTIMEMEGYDCKNDVWKDTKRWLCSECNTGEWYNEFKKEYPSDIEKEIAKYSKCNMITPYDHPDGCITGGYDNYHVDVRYTLFVKIFGEDVNKDNNDLFKIYLEDRSNFNISCLENLDKIINTTGTYNKDDYINTIKTSQVYSNSKSETYIKYLYGNRYNGITAKTIISSLFSEYMNMKTSEFERNYLANKPKQTEEDKNKRLKKAELKREIKKLKKSSNIDKDLLKQLQQEFKDIVL